MSIENQERLGEIKEINSLTNIIILKKTNTRTLQKQQQ
jgi:hypothetical protein